MNHLIDFQTAKTLVNNFVSDSVLGQVAVNWALGGTVGKNHLQLPNQSTGVMAWFCLDQSASGNQLPFFLAFEKFSNFTTNPYPSQPANSSLDVANSQFAYSPGQPVGTLLKTHKESLANPINQVVTSAEVVQFINSFNQNFPKDNNNEKFNKEPLAFFSNEIPPGETSSDWDQFISQPNLAAIRYYFGYDPTETTNDIRIVMVGVNSQGENLLSGNSNDLIIERQIP